MKETNNVILTPLVSLDTPGKATVEVVILADPVRYTCCVAYIYNTHSTLHCILLLHIATILCIDMYSNNRVSILLQCPSLHHSIKCLCMFSGWP